MATKRHAGSADWTDPDDTPELTADLRDKAEEFHGDAFVRRRPGGWPVIGPLTDGQGGFLRPRVERHPGIAVAWPQPWRGSRGTPDTAQGIAPLDDQNDTSGHR
jgi:hypothetical protein